MALNNVPVGAIPEHIFCGINLGVRSARAHSIGSPDKVTVTLKQAQQMLPDDFSRFVACLLARYELLTREDLIAISLTVANGSSDGLLKSLEDQFGLTFDIQKACGGMHSRDTAKDKLAKVISNGGLRTMEPPATSVRVKTQMYEEGLSPFVALTRKGAKAIKILAKSNGKTVSIKDIQIPPQKSAVAIPQWLHFRQVGDLIALVIAGASATNGSIYNGIHTSCLVNELLSEVVIKFKHGENQRYFKPDVGLSLTYLMANSTGTNKRSLKAWVEHDTTSNSRDAIKNKVVNYLLYVINQGDQTPPYLLLTSSSDDRMKKTIEPAVREALEQVIGMSYTDYTEMFGRIAFATHNDISEVGMLGKEEAGLWRKWDFENKCFKSKKWTLVALGAEEKSANKEPFQAVVSHQEVDDIREREGSSCGLVGYRDEDIEVTPASASIGWREEVA